MSKKRDHPGAEHERRDGDGDNTKLVIEHYNARPQKSGAEREFSPIFQLKAFNNYIKSILIIRYVRPGDRVLDVCFGKGGDLLKYKNARIKELVGVDIAKVSIDHAKERFNTGRFKFIAKFLVVDCFSVLEFLIICICIV
jgi:mRNA (guanine-N7-)-methyltransferase